MYTDKQSFILPAAHIYRLKQYPWKSVFIRGKTVF